MNLFQLASFLPLDFQYFVILFCRYTGNNCGYRSERTEITYYISLEKYFIKQSFSDFMRVSCRALKVIFLVRCTL